MSRFAAIAFAAVAVSIGGCDAERVPPEDLDFDRRPPSNLPQALMLRFAEVKGEGSARESWEVEVLQMGGDVRVRGSVRTGGATVPVYDVMEPEDYVEFWSWLQGFPVDRARLVEDESFPETDWRKSLHVDVVLDEQTRWRSRNTWGRPLLGTPWVDRIETRLHNLALNLAHRELDREERDVLTPDTGRGHPDRRRASRATLPAACPMSTDDPGEVPVLVVDTNLLVAWLFRPSASGPAAIIDAWGRGELRLCVSDAVLSEMRATLSRLPVQSGRKAKLLDRLADPGFTNHLAAPPDSGFRCADFTDDKFLHLAAAADTDALITSDRALLDVDGFPVPIMKSGQWVRASRRCKEQEPDGPTA